MKVFHYRRSLEDYLKKSDPNIGFVPTMGALHAGHIALVEAAKAATSLCVVSIFVNPRQFNNAEDLQKYPRTIAGDLAMLRNAGADIVFIPSMGEIYEEPASIALPLGPLEHVFEGHYRPGHFQGVVDVLFAFFSLIHPKEVFFGQKDLQQCMVVEKLVRNYFPEIHQNNCPTLREHSGLAMSSRNRRLTAPGQIKAAVIYKELLHLASTDKSLREEKVESLNHLLAAGIDTEYLDLVALPDMNKLEEKEPNLKMAIVFAGYLEGVRLIDNIVL